MLTLCDQEVVQVARDGVQDQLLRQVVLDRMDKYLIRLARQRTESVGITSRAIACEAIVGIIMTSQKWVFTPIAEMQLI